MLIELPKGKYIPAFGRLKKKPVLVSRNTVAVSTFLNLSESVEIAHVCEGITEEIRHVLSRAGSFAVLCNPKPFGPGHQAEVAPTIIVGGTIRVHSHEMRISAYAMDVVGGYYVWSECFDHEISDDFKIQEYVAQRVASGLSRAAGTGAVASNWSGADEITERRVWLANIQASEPQLQEVSAN